MDDPLSPPAIDPLDLLSYRRAVADLYGEVRRRSPSQDTWRWWVDERDQLLASHPASPYVAGEIPFHRLAYHAYDPALRLGPVAVDAAEPYTLTIGHSSHGGTPARRFGTMTFDVDGTACTLSAFWLDTYGGGVFVPLRDATNGRSTYGGGRYLLDTAKSADLGGADGRLILDLNFAYHPSCVHDPRWSCPLAPADERLPVAIRAGERLPDARAPAGRVDVEVTEIVPGELDVRIGDGRRCRVLLPAGIGVPGIDDETFAAALVEELAARGVTLPDVVDASSLLRSAPDLLDAVSGRTDDR